MIIEKVKEAWQKLAPSLVGRKVEFDNRIADCKDVGTISRVIVEGDFVIIESPEIEAAHKAGRAWSKHIRFKVGEERYPELIGDTIFCDLDDDRQIRIA